MPEDRPGPGHLARAEGPPSARARAALSADLRRELADARLRLQEAGLRAEAHRVVGDDDAAAEAVREQQQVLAEIQDRLGRTISAAVLQRDAEQVVADASPAVAHAATAGKTRDDGRRVPALSGVASILVMIAVAVGAVLGMNAGGVDRVEVAGVPADESVASTPPSPDTTAAGITAPDPPAGTSDDTPSPSAPVGRVASPAASSAGSGSEPGTSDAPVDPVPPGDDREPAPQLDGVIDDLVDVADGLGDPVPDPDPSDTETETEPPRPDVELSGPETETLPDGADDLLPGGDDLSRDDELEPGGFDPASTAQ